MTPAIRLNEVSVVRNESAIVNDVHWEVWPDQRWVIIGPNGAGKTTLLRVAAAQIQPTAGQAIILDEELGKVNVFELRTRIGFASSSLASRIPNTETVLNAVMTASYGVTGRWNEEYEGVDERRALRVLNEWQLSEYADRAFGTLSDGEKKRVQIARAVMTDPELLLLDEPVASLDLKSREETIKVIGNYAASPTAPAIVMVTHHLEEIPSGFTHAAIMVDGRIFAAGEIDATITSDKLSEAYGLSLSVEKHENRFSVRHH